MNNEQYEIWEACSAIANNLAYILESLQEITKQLSGIEMNTRNIG